MEFFLEMLLTLAFALLLSFPLAMLLSMATTSRNGTNDPPSETVVDDRSVTEEEVSFALKMDAPVSHSERNFLLVDDNVESVDRLDETATGNGKSSDEGGESVVLTPEVESTANVIAEEIIVRGQEKQSDSVGEIGAQHKELMLQTTEADHTASVSPVADERITQEQAEQSDTTVKTSGCVENEESGEVLVADSDELRDEETNTTEERITQGQEQRSDKTQGTSVCLENEESGDVVIDETDELRDEENNTVEEIITQGHDQRSDKTEVENVESGDVVVAESEEVRVEETHMVEESEHTQEENEAKEELSIEEDDDDWEGIEKSELEKAFGATAKLLEESGKLEEVGAEAKMELYGLHKIATEGSCRETQPMAVMLSARAKWNAWQKLGNMTQEEAMEQYLALISKEIPGFINTVRKMPEMETSVVLPPNTGSIEDPTTLKTTDVESSKNGKDESIV